MAVKRSPGERILELCKTYSIDRSTLVERSGLDTDLIRRIEEGYIPDLAPLLKISRALGVRLGTLLDDHEELGPVITRKGDVVAAARFVTGLPGNGTEVDLGSLAAGTIVPKAKDQGTSSEVPHKGLHFNALAAAKGGRHMEPFIVDIEADAEQGKSSHEGEEFIHVLEGALALEYGAASHTLNEGDSVYYDSIVPHRVLAGGGKPARILAVIYAPV
jgi:quercetin dioxygenase-like cupin family protein/transcriptional regulator with XRE-family HTH domain